MNIAFLSSVNPTNPLNKNNFIYYIYQNIQQNHHTTWISQPQTEFHQAYHDDENYPFNKNNYSLLFGKLLSDIINYECYDLIICCDDFLLAYLTTKTPIIYIKEYTIKLHQQNPIINDSEHLQFIEALALEKRAIQNATHIVCSSERVKTDIINDYQTIPKKVSVIDIEANTNNNIILQQGISKKYSEENRNWEKWREAMNQIINQLINDIEEKVFIPVFAINLQERKDRRDHIIHEFENKDEFEFNLIEACKDHLGTVGLWNSIIKIVKMAKEKKEDVIIICEDDHYFTENYSAKLLFKEIQEAYIQGADILAGGIGGFGLAIPVGYKRYWVDWLWCTQFIVVYASLFERILQYSYKETDTVDGVLSTLTNNKMVVYPFISEQKDFGYSDVTQSNMDNQGRIREHFSHSNRKLKLIEQVYQLNKVK